MCGILGAFSAGITCTTKNSREKAMHELAHRGPDDLGMEEYFLSSVSAFLGQTRLSIIDLSPGGHQPFESQDGRYSIVFNGEIYNYLELKQDLHRLGHTFQTQSDTEVLLHAWIEWGENCISRLLGMFAFAILDKYLQKAFLVRDAFGIKPLFYSAKHGNFVFASEIPALAELSMLDRQLNQSAAIDFLRYGKYDRSENTFLENVSQILPGNLIELNLTGGLSDFTIKKWWKPNLSKPIKISFEDAAEELRSLFLSSVSKQMRSDVPLAAALSGGVDSSGILGAMRYLEPDAELKSFSYISADASTSEEQWVDLVNRYTNAKPHKIYIDGTSMMNELDNLIIKQGEPFGSTSIYAQYKVFEAARLEGIKVILDGQGADELFAGYHGYQHSRIDSLTENHNYAQLAKFLFGWSRYPNRPVEQTIKYAISKFMPQLLRSSLRNRNRVGAQPSWISKEFTMRELEINKGWDNFESFSGVNWNGRRVSEQLYKDLTRMSLPSLLRHADRNSMAWSIESRVPFLTNEIAEFALCLPEEFLISPEGESKSVLRAALRGLVPEEVLYRRDKIGFQTPENDLMRNRILIDHIRECSFSNEGILDKSQVLKFAQAYLEGNCSDTRQFWRLYNFIRWSQLMNVNI